jgi:hypothetical protein
LQFESDPNAKDKDDDDDSVIGRKRKKMEEKEIENQEVGDNRQTDRQTVIPLLLSVI